MVTQEQRQQFRQRLQDLRTYREQNPGKGYIEWKSYQNGGQTEELIDGGVPFEIIVEPTGTKAEEIARRRRARGFLNDFNKVTDYNNIKNAAGWLPGIGDATEVVDIISDIKNGNYTQAAIGLSLLAVPGTYANKLYKQTRNSLASLAFKPIKNIDNTNLPDTKTLYEIDYQYKDPNILRQGYRTSGNSTHTRRTETQHWKEDITDPNNIPPLKLADDRIVIDRVQRDPVIKEVVNWNDKPKGEYVEIFEPVERITITPGKIGRYVGEYQNPNLNPTRVVQTIRRDQLFDNKHRFISPNSNSYIYTDRHTIPLIYKHQNGGQIPVTRSTIQDYTPVIPDSAVQYKGPLYTDMTGKKYTEEQVNEYYNNTTDEIDRFTGRPMVRGIDPVLNLRDAIDFTPVGDAATAYDLYNAVSNKDWSVAGLAALSLLPIVPSQINKAVKITRPVPSFDRDYERKLWEQKAKEVEERNKLYADTRNRVYGVIERLMEDPAYIQRAEEVAKEFGDDYITPYADMFMAYNVDPTILPNITTIDRNLSAAATMRKTPEGTYELGVNPVERLPYDIEHELSHYSDLVKSGTTNAEAGNNMFYQMTKDLDKKVDERDRYFKNPSEQKAHMNQLREYMFQNGYITNRGQKVTVKEMRKLLDDIKERQDMRGMVRAAKQFKSLKTYTKWFNRIPLLNVTALAIPGTMSMLQNSNPNNENDI